MNQTKFPLWVWLFLYPFLTFSQTTITGELQKWHAVTLTFNGPNTSENNSKNPFLDYRLNVTFTSPKGEKFIVPGFYAADGNAAETSATSGNKWRVRFSPNATGEWSYNASFRTGTNVAVNLNKDAGNPTSFNGASGSFTISNSTKTAPDNRARGRLNYVGERYLRFAETGAYFLKAGSDSPENLLAYNDFDNTIAKKTWNPHAQDWRSGDPKWKGDRGKELVGAINYLASKGMNAFSFLTLSVKGDGKDVWPWTASSNDKLDGNTGTDAQNRLRYDVSKLAQWEILFTHADAKGMYLHFKTQETENDRLLDNGELGVQRKLYYRELIARFGHHLALNWNLGEEHNFYQELNDRQNTRVKSYANYIRTVDPYQNHIVIHSFPDTWHQEGLYRPLLGNNSVLTGASTQIHINSVHADVKKWILESKNAGKQWVVANDEQGGHQAGVTADANFSGNRGSLADNRKDTRHKVLWGTLMAGGAGVEYYFGYNTGETDLTAQNLRSRDMKWNDAKLALDFFNNYLPFWEMETSDGLTSSTNDFCFSKRNETYVIYLPNGGSTNLNLAGANGNFNIRWFDPKNGGALKKGSVADITGGGTRGIGNPPGNSSSDWVVLVQKNDVVSGTEKKCSFDLSAISDFTNTNVSGFSPAYVDDARNALAIDAAKYKNSYAAAETIFGGDTEVYDITLNTLTELDGESSYTLSVNGTVVGTYKNPTTTTDYLPSSKLFEGIRVQNGDLIRVTFNSHTNGKIPEGNGTAFSRGRWTSLNFKCQSTVPPASPDECVADAEERNGRVVLEAESLNIASGWVSKSSINGFSGRGYIDWQGDDSFNVPGKGTITAKIKINTPGTYLFQWRNKVGEGTNTTERNDSWLRFPDADDFFGQRGSSIVYPKGSGKSPNPNGASSDGWFKVYLGGTTNWTWASSTSDHDSHKIYVTFRNSGIYTMEISGRSKHHLIDRIVLSANGVDATSLSLPETVCSNGDIPVSVSSVALDPKSASIDVGTTLHLSATVSPADASNKKVLWTSSNPAIASIDQNGIVSALAPGEVRFVVTTEDGQHTDEARITVNESSGQSVPVQRIYVTPQRFTLEEGQTDRLSYEITPSNATNQNAVWSSSDTSIALVDQEGVVRALKAGTAKIMARSLDGNKLSDATLTVTKRTGDTGAVEGVEVAPKSTKVVIGNSLVLTYSVIPKNAPNTKVIWSSNDDAIATVNQNGVVTGISLGHAVITVTTEDGGYSASVDLEVIKAPTIDIPVQNVYVTPQKLTFEVGQTVVLQAKITPLNASNQNLIWTSSDATIAKVDANGMVTALKEGVVEIEAMTEDGRRRSDATLTIVPGSGDKVSVSGIELNPAFLILKKGEARKLIYTINPINATNKTVIWSSEDGQLASVDQNGWVTALQEGSVTISATTVDGNFVGTTTVSIVLEEEVLIPLKNIYVTPQRLTLAVGQSKQLSYIATPLNASNTRVTWKSMDERIAIVDQSGKVTALKPGKVEIEATSEDGRLKSDATLTVIANLESEKGSILTYPNPTHDELRVDGIIGKQGWIGVYGYNGVLKKQVRVEGDGTQIVSLAGLPTGMYVVKVIDEEKIETRTIIKL